MATLKDIALKTGVSLTTVSNVFNDKYGSVSLERREMILQTAQNLGYRLNRRARQFRKQANLTLSVLIDSRITSSNVWRPTIALNILVLQGIGSYATSKGYHLHLIVPQHGKDIEEIQSQIIEQNAADGIALIGLNTNSSEEITGLLDKLLECDIPAVTIDLRIAEKGVPTVYMDLKKGIKEAVDKICQLGHTKIGYIGIPGLTGNTERASRLDIFSRELQDRGIVMPKEWVMETKTELSAYRNTLELMRAKNTPTCIFYSSDHFAMAGMEAISDLGMTVPDDVSILGLDGAPYAQECPVPLATIAQDFFKQGVMLAKVLIDQINQKDEPVPHITLVPSNFVHRQSLGVAKGYKENLIDNISL